MEKSFKKKMLIVAAMHLVLSVWIYSVHESNSNHIRMIRVARLKHSPNYNELLARRPWNEAWYDSALGAFFLFQPQFWLLDNLPPKLVDAIREAPDWPKVVLALFSIPISSLCFGWLYAKAVDRLNRFPILGRKLF